MQLGNLRFQDLPRLRGYDGKKKACYTHCLLECGRGDGCGFVHVDKDEISDEFAQDLCKAIEPALAYVFRNYSAEQFRALGRGQKRGRET